MGEERDETGTVGTHRQYQRGGDKWQARDVTGTVIGAGHERSNQV